MRFLNKKGQGTIEFLICAPIMLGLIIVMFDLAKIQIAKWDVMNATRDTARWISLQPKDSVVLKTDVPRCMAQKFFESSSYENMYDPQQIMIDFQPGAHRGDVIVVKGCAVVKTTDVSKLLSINKANNQVCYSYYLHRSLDSAGNKQNAAKSWRDAQQSCGG